MFSFTTRRIILLSTILCVLLNTGCIGDRYSPITITNTTSDTLTIQLKENINFRTEKEESSTFSDGLGTYKLAPHEIFYIGSAINEIDNDIPFSGIKVICKGDTLIDNQGNAKNLFDKTLFGSLKFPYNISIKKH